MADTDPALRSHTGTTVPHETVARQAVVLVHGMGEQVPMETIRSFAEAVWKSDTSVHKETREVGEADPGTLYFVPDPHTGSRELRKISTRKSRERTSESNGPAAKPDRVRTDFFEFYWADTTRNTTWRDFLLWYYRLCFRSPRGDVPKPVFWAWVNLWVINGVAVLLALVPTIWGIKNRLLAELSG